MSTEGAMMAKALFGHVGGAEARLAAEVTRLRARIRELEHEVSRLRADEIRLDDLEVELREAAIV